MEPISVYTEARFQVHCIGYFSKRNRKPAKFEKIALLLLESKCLHRKIVSSCLAGRFLVVLGAGSWQDLRFRVQGGVRLFFCSDVALCEVNSSSKSAHVQKNETSEGKAPHSFHRDHLFSDLRGSLSDSGQRVWLRQPDAWNSWSCRYNY